MSEKNFAEKEYTNLTIKRTTKDRLAKYGTKDMTWDVLVNKVLDELDSLRLLKRAVEEETDGECKQDIWNRMHLLKVMKDIAKDEKE